MAARELTGSLDGAGLRVGIVVSRFNRSVTEGLLAGALEALEKYGVAAEDVVVVRVPGAFEVPFAARRLAGAGVYDALICLGAVVRGETPHFEYIASAVAHGLTAAAAATGVPMAFGVLTTNTVEEALARAGDGPGHKGREAARAAIEMASVVARLAGGASTESS